MATLRNSENVAVPPAAPVRSPPPSPGTAGPHPAVRARRPFGPSVCARPQACADRPESRARPQVRGATPNTCSATHRLPGSDRVHSPHRLAVRSSRPSRRGPRRCGRRPRASRARPAPAHASVAPRRTARTAPRARPDRRNSAPASSAPRAFRAHARRRREPMSPLIPSSRLLELSAFASDVLGARSAPTNGNHSSALNNAQRAPPLRNVSCSRRSARSCRA